MITIALALASSAVWPSAWACTYPGFTDHQPITVVFRRTSRGTFSSGGLEYGVVRETAVGLIAAASWSEIAGGKPLVSAFVIAIDKTTGAFTRNTVDANFDQPHDFASGHCIQRP